MRRLTPLLAVLLLAACNGGTPTQGGTTSTTAATTITAGAPSAAVFRTHAEVVCKAMIGQLGTLRGQNLSATKLAAAVDEAVKKLRKVRAPSSLSGTYLQYVAVLQKERTALAAGNVQKGRKLRRKANDLARTLGLKRCLQPKF